MDKECKRCGGDMDIKTDFLFNIEFLLCYKCGNVVFLNDGLGNVRYNLTKKKKDE